MSISIAPLQGDYPGALPTPVWLKMKGSRQVYLSRYCTILLFTC